MNKLVGSCVSTFLRQEQLGKVQSSLCIVFVNVLLETRKIN